MAAVEEERFRRVKHWAGFPAQAIATRAIHRLPARWAEGGIVARRGAAGIAGAADGGVAGPMRTGAADPGADVPANVVGSGAIPPPLSAGVHVRHLWSAQGITRATTGSGANRCAASPTASETRRLSMGTASDPSGAGGISTMRVSRTGLPAAIASLAAAFSRCSRSRRIPAPAG